MRIARSAFTRRPAPTSADSSPAGWRRCRSIWKNRSCAWTNPVARARSTRDCARIVGTPSASRVTVTGCARPGQRQRAVGDRQAAPQHDPQVSAAGHGDDDHRRDDQEEEAEDVPAHGLGDPSSPCAGGDSGTGDRGPGKTKSTPVTLHERQPGTGVSSAEVLHRCSLVPGPRSPISGFSARAGSRVRSRPSYPRAMILPALLTSSESMSRLFDDDPRWAQVLARSADAEGRFVYAVKSTGVFCRPDLPEPAAAPRPGAVLRSTPPTPSAPASGPACAASPMAPVRSPTGAKAVARGGGLPAHPRRRDRWSCPTWRR